MADGVNRISRIRAIVSPQANRPAAVEVHPHDFRIQAVLAGSEQHPRTFPKSLARMHEGHPFIAVPGRAHEEAFRRPATGQALTDEPRRKDARVVDHEQVAGPQQRRQVGELVMPHISARAVECEQPRGAPLYRGILGNQLVGQVEVEVGDVHGGIQTNGPNPPRGIRALTYFERVFGLVNDDRLEHDANCLTRVLQSV